jgi:hypothetical protein
MTIFQKVSSGRAQEPSRARGQHKMHDSSNEDHPIVRSEKVGFGESSRTRAHRFLTSERWAIGIVRTPIHFFLDASFVPTIQWVGDCGPLEFLADCFGIVDGSRRTILAERFTYRGSSEVSSCGAKRIRTGRGYITSIAIDEDGRTISEIPAIDTGRHMSYPCTIPDGDTSSRKN